SEIVEIRSGHHIGPGCNEAATGDKIIVNNKSKHPNARGRDRSFRDLHHYRRREGYEPGDEEGQAELRLEVTRKTWFVMEEGERQSAPYDRQAASKSVSKPAMQLFAGQMMNFLLAIVIFFILGAIQGVPSNEAFVGEIVPDSPAEEAGFKTGDKIVLIDGQSITSWEEFTTIVRDHPGDELTMTVEREGATEQLHVVPKEVEIEDTTIGQIGIGAKYEKSLLKSVQFGFTYTYEVSTLIFKSLGMLITGQYSLDMLAG